MTIYAVDKYIDVIKPCEGKEDHSRFGFPSRFEYFDTDEEARAFIRQRADTECAKAEKELKRAIARTKKCNRKFGLINGDAAGESK